MREHFADDNWEKKLLYSGLTIGVALLLVLGLKNYEKKLSPNVTNGLIVVVVLAALFVMVKTIPDNVDEEHFYQGDEAISEISSISDDHEHFFNQDLNERNQGLQAAMVDQASDSQPEAGSEARRPGEFNPNDGVEDFPSGRTRNCPAAGFASVNQVNNASGGDAGIVQDVNRPYVDASNPGRFGNLEEEQQLNLSNPALGNIGGLGGDANYQSYHPGNNNDPLPPATPGGVSAYSGYRITKQDDRDYYKKYYGGRSPQSRTVSGTVGGTEKLSSWDAASCVQSGASGRLDGISTPQPIDKATRIAALTASKSAIFVQTAQGLFTPSLSAQINKKLDDRLQLFYLQTDASALTRKDENTALHSYVNSELRGLLDNLNNFSLNNIKQLTPISDTPVPTSANTTGNPGTLQNGINMPTLMRLNQILYFDTVLPRAPNQGQFTYTETGGVKVYNDSQVQNVNIQSPNLALSQLFIRVVAVKKARNEAEFTRLTQINLGPSATTGSPSQESFADFPSANFENFDANELLPAATGSSDTFGSFDHNNDNNNNHVTEQPNKMESFSNNGRTLDIRDMNGGGFQPLDRKGPITNVSGRYAEAFVEVGVDTSMANNVGYALLQEDVKSLIPVPSGL